MVSYVGAMNEIMSILHTHNLPLTREPFNGIVWFYKGGVP